MAAKPKSKAPAKKAVKVKKAAKPAAKTKPPTPATGSLDSIMKRTFLKRMGG